MVTERIKKKFGEKIVEKIFLICAFAAVLSLVIITVFIFMQGIPGFQEVGFTKMVFGKVWDPSTDQYGLLPMILGSLYSTAGAVLIGGTIGIFTAVFMSQFAHRRIASVMRPIINILAGIPSVVYGLFAWLFIVPMLKDFVKANFDVSRYFGTGLLAVIAVLAIMILPTIISVSETSIREVSKGYIEGSYALGANKIQTIFKIILPSAKSGIIASVVLGIGRAIGETMAVMMVAGSSPIIPKALTDKITTLTSLIISDMAYADGTKRKVLFAAGVVLFVLILILNLTVTSFLKRKKEFVEKKPSAIKRFLSFAGEKISNLLKNIWKAIPKFISGLCKRAGNFISEVRYKTFKYFKRANQYVFSVLFTLCAVFTCFVLFYIIYYILSNGLGGINWEFLTTGVNDVLGTEGIYPMIVSTVYLVLLTLAIAMPIGIFSAIYLTQYAKQGPFVNAIRLAIECLAGIPSIIYGMFGLVFFIETLRIGANANGIAGTSVLSGALTVSIMILPTIIRTTEEALLTVPNSYRDGSLALGASKLYTIRKVVIPSAITGIITSIILSIGRVVGETAAIIYTFGTSDNIPKTIFSSGKTLAVHTYTTITNGISANRDRIAFSTAAVLVLIIIILNVCSSIIGERIRRKREGR